MPRRSSSKPPKQHASKKAVPKKSAAPDPSAPQRLQRLLASAGFGSRRQCEELIEAGRVEVDRKTVTKLGTTVDPSASKVRVDGVPLKQQKLVYYAVNKPVGVVTTNSDPQGRPRVVDLVPKSERVFAVGRLDLSSEGLILLTNDGDLAQHLTHPKYGVRKVYRVTVAGKVEGETMRQMRNGIYIAEGHVRVEGARILKSRARATELEIVLREGKNREIRRILARLGHKVQQLRRIAIGPLRLGDMPSGAYRIVSREEVRKMRDATQAGVGEDHRPTKRGSKKSSPRKSSGSKPSGTKSAGKSFSKPKRSSDSRGARRVAAPGIERPIVGAVIGGDAPKEESPRRKPAKGGRSAVKKRTGTKRAGTKRGGPKRARTRDESTRGKSASSSRRVGSTGKKKAAAKKRVQRKRKR